MEKKSGHDTKKRGKKYRASLKKFDITKNYTFPEACQLVKDTSYTKFDSSVDLAVNLGVDPAHADQMVRGAVPLPHGIGKTIRVVVFARGDKAAEAEKAGADSVGADDLATKIQEGWMDFDTVVATPDMMGVVGKLGKVLGPRGLMPNPKLGTVTFEVGKAIKELKAGRTEYRADKGGIVHALIGKASFSAEQLAENGQVVMDALMRAKPASVKGMYLKKITLSASMGPGVKIDPAVYRT